MLNIYLLQLFLKDLTYCKWADPTIVGVPGVPIYNGRPVVLDDSSLSTLSGFINKMRPQLPFDFDHAIGFMK